MRQTHLKLRDLKSRLPFLPRENTHKQTLTAAIFFPATSPSPTAFLLPGVSLSHFRRSFELYTSGDQQQQQLLRETFLPPAACTTSLPIFR